MPSVQALLSVVIAILATTTTAPCGGRDVAQSGPSRGRCDGYVISAWRQSHTADLTALVEMLPTLREEAVEGAEDDEKGEPSARTRFDVSVSLVVSDGVARCAEVSEHPSFHSVPRSLFLRCGRLTC